MTTFDQIEFWRYAYSNLKDNRNRSAFAEYMVAKALGVSEPPLTSWESYDIKTASGVKVEVKTSGYIQSWKQTKPTIPTFDIKQKQGWAGETNEYDGIKDRQADVYVFCLHNEKDKDKADPLQSDQWIFYVVSTIRINELLEDQKTVGLSTIEEVLGARALKFEEIKQEVITSYGSSTNASQ